MGYEPQDGSPEQGAPKEERERHPPTSYSVKFDMNPHRYYPVHSSSFSIDRNQNLNLRELQEEGQHPYEKPVLKPILKARPEGVDEEKALLSRSTPAYTNRVFSGEQESVFNPLVLESAEYQLPPTSGVHGVARQGERGHRRREREEVPPQYGSVERGQLGPEGYRRQFRPAMSVVERSQPQYAELRSSQREGQVPLYERVEGGRAEERQESFSALDGSRRPWGPPQRNADESNSHQYARAPGSYNSQSDLFNEGNADGFVGHGSSRGEQGQHDGDRGWSGGRRRDEGGRRARRPRPPIGENRQSSIGQLRMHGMLDDRDQEGGGTRRNLQRGLSVVEAALLAPLTQQQADIINEASKKPDFDESRFSKQLEEEGVIPHPDLIPKYPLEELIPFLTKLACAFHSYGATANRTEWHMCEISRAMGVIASYSVTPTMIVITFGIPQGMDAISRTIRIDQNIVACGKLYLVDQLITKIIMKRVTLYEANDELQRILDKEPNYPKSVIFLAHALCSGSSAIVCFNSGWMEVMIGTLLGLLSGGIRRAAEMSTTLDRILDVLLAFIICVIAIPITSYSEDICFSALVLGALIWSLPGLPLTLAVRELATGNLLAGTIRMFASFMTALKLGFGIAMGSSVPLWVNKSQIAQPCAVIASNWARIPTFFIVTSCFNILLDSHIKQWPGQIASAAVGYIISFTLGTLLNVQTEIVVVLAAFGVAITGNIYTRITRYPGVNYIFSGILLLVPGSVGVLGAVALFSQNAWSGLNFGFTMVLVGFCITIGTLLADLIVFPHSSLNHHLF